MRVVSRAASARHEAELATRNSRKASVIRCTGTPLLHWSPKGGVFLYDFLRRDTVTGSWAKMVHFLLFFMLVMWPVQWSWGTIVELKKLHNYPVDYVDIAFDRSSTTAAADPSRQVSRGLWAKNVTAITVFAYAHKIVPHRHFSRRCGSGRRADSQTSTVRTTSTTAISTAESITLEAAVRLDLESEYIRLCQNRH